MEVLVATMVAAMSATAVFSVVLSAQVGGVRSNKRETAAMALKAAQEQLKVYVTAVPNESAFSPPKWAIDTNPGWALAAGDHEVNDLLYLPQLTGTLLQQSPSLKYVVTDVDCGFGVGAGACKSVTFTLTYPD